MWIYTKYSNKDEQPPIKFYPHIIISTIHKGMVISHTAIVAAGRGWVMCRGEGASRLCHRRRRRGSRSRAIVVRRRYGGGATREEVEVEVEREWWFVLAASGEVVINTSSLSFLARNAASLGRQHTPDFVYYYCIIIWAEKFGRICVVLSNESPEISTPDLGDPRK